LHDEAGSPLKLLLQGAAKVGACNVLEVRTMIIG